MKTGTKFAVAGCTIGTVTAVAPAVYATVQNNIRSPLNNHDFLTCEGNKLITSGGVETVLRGMNLNDELFGCNNSGVDLSAYNGEMFRLASERFGDYGARQIFKKLYESLVTPEDIKYLKKLGVNCVRIPLRYNTLLKNGDVSEKIDFSGLDTIIKKCKKAGIYVILDLHSAPGYQSNDKSCGKADACGLFEGGKKGLDFRNEVIKIWLKISDHYKNEPTVAAYDLLNRPLHYVAEYEKYVHLLSKFYRRAVKAIRSRGDNHVVILESVSEPSAFYDADAVKNTNIALGIYSHYHTVYESDSVIRQIVEANRNAVPIIACKARLYDEKTYVLDTMEKYGISWLTGDYKGNGSGSFLFRKAYPEIDIASDSYDEINKKLDELAGLKTFKKNETLEKSLKDIFNTDRKVTKKPEIKYAYGKVMSAGI